MSAPYPAFDQASASTPLPRMPSQLATPTTERLASSQHSLLPGSNSSSGHSSALAECDCPEAQRERERLDILDRRIAEAAYTLHSGVQRPFTPVPTNLQLQGVDLFGSYYGISGLCKTLRDTNDQLKLAGFPSDRTLGSLSEAWTLGFENGMGSTG